MLSLVPELTIAWDVDTNAIGGRATPGGSIVFTVSDAIDRGMTGPQNRRAQPDIQADGSYTAAFVPQVDLAPGGSLVAITWASLRGLPSGAAVTSPKVSTTSPGLARVFDARFWKPAWTPSSSRR